MASNVLLVTVTKVETLAVLDVFASSKTWSREHFGNKTYYRLGECGGVKVYLVQSEMGSSSPGASLQTVTEAITYCKPVAVIMVGIAFGIDPSKRKLGDILVSRQISVYELQKIPQNGAQINRDDRVKVPIRLLDKFISAELDWTHDEVKIHFGVILCGSKLIANKSFRDQLLINEPEAIGGEMEGGGLYSAAVVEKVDWIIVKAISDWADGSKDDTMQQIAALNAAQFVHHVISQNGLMLRRRVPNQRKVKVEKKVAGRIIDGGYSDLTMTKAFISYSWDNDDHKDWVRELAARLRRDGIDVTLDQWHLVPGDELPKFMEQAVRESEYVLVVCTHKYKERSNNRQGGVGYEGDIMTAEVMSTGNQRKFIPILRQQSWIDSAPSWLLGKYYIDFSSSSYSETSYDDLLTTLLGTREKAPPIGAGKKDESLAIIARAGPRVMTYPDFEPVQITGIIVDQVGTPRNDGTRGSALYRVPFRMSQRPPHEWAEIFVNAWNHPPSFTSAHRPGIASVIGDTIVLDGTTIEEVRDYHRDTLILCVQEANKKYKELSDRWKQDNELEQERLSKHKRNIDDISNQIEFNPSDEIATSEGILSPLTRKDVLEIIQTARSQGRTPELRNAKLTGIDLNGENLSGVDFTKADLSFADLEQANLENTIFQGANLDKAILIRAHMKNANLRRASLKDTNLYKPTLTNADLSEVDLKPTRVNFDEARLDYAKLFETDLSGHDLTRAILTGAEYSSSTVWPHDFDPEKAGAILK